MAVEILVGDALTRLQHMPDESVHCAVTSPPYWGLRSYEGDDGMIGMEPTFDEHLDRLVTVFRELRRVLRSDGTFWLNYGDAYSTGGGRILGNRPVGSLGRAPHPGQKNAGIPIKNLLMMPARIALAMQSDGWILRSEIVWHKSRAMPEACQRSAYECS